MKQFTIYIDSQEQARYVRDAGQTQKNNPNDEIIEVVEKSAHAELFEMVNSLFCDAQGNPTFEGSEGDLKYFIDVMNKQRTVK